MGTLNFLICLVLLLVTQLMAQAKPDLQATTSSTASTAIASDKQPAVEPCQALNAKSPPGAHTVKLSWNASVPASTSSADAVIGYIVYRSRTPNDLKSLPINLRRITDTACFDVNVSPGADYYYVIRAVSANGISGPSNQVHVHIPGEAIPLGE